MCKYQKIGGNGRREKERGKERKDRANYLNESAPPPKP
jgi:hypothetical protein